MRYIGSIFRRKQEKKKRAGPAVIDEIYVYYLFLPLLYSS